MNRELSNLLATIHRDGGHYEALHGTEKAIRDAVIVVNRDRINIPGEPAEIFIIEYATQTPDSVSMHRRPLRDWPDWVRGIAGMHPTDNHLRLITLMRKNFGELTRARKLPGVRGSELQRQLEQDILSLARELCTPTVDWTQADPSVREMLLPALRQYRHNDSDEFVSGYEREATEAIVTQLIQTKDAPALCEDEGCPHAGTAHVCRSPRCSGDGVAEQECVTLTGVDSPTAATSAAKDFLKGPRHDRLVTGTYCPYISKMGPTGMFLSFPGVEDCFTLDQIKEIDRVGALLHEQRALHEDYVPWDRDCKTIDQQELKDDSLLQAIAQVKK